jgi:hypothetical protein
MDGAESVEVFSTEDALADGEDRAEFLFGLGVFALRGEGKRQKGAGGESVGMVGSVDLFAEVENFEQLGLGFAVAALGKEGAGVIVPVVEFINVAGHNEVECKGLDARLATGFGRARQAWNSPVNNVGRTFNKSSLRARAGSRFLLAFISSLKAVRW